MMVRRQRSEIYGESRRRTWWILAAALVAGCSLTFPVTHVRSDSPLRATRMEIREFKIDQAGIVSFDGWPPQDLGSQLAREVAGRLEDAGVSAVVGNDGDSGTDFTMQGRIVAAKATSDSVVIKALFFLFAQNIVHIEVEGTVRNNKTGTLVGNFSCLSRTCPESWMADIRTPADRCLRWVGAEIANLVVMDAYHDTSGRFGKCAG